MISPFKTEEGNLLLCTTITAMNLKKLVSDFLHWFALALSAALFLLLLSLL